MESQDSRSKIVQLFLMGKLLGSVEVYPDTKFRDIYNNALSLALNLNPGFDFTYFVADLVGDQGIFKSDYMSFLLHDPSGGAYKTKLDEKRQKKPSYFDRIVSVNIRRASGNDVKMMMNSILNPPSSSNNYLVLPASSQSKSIQLYVDSQLIGTMMISPQNSLKEIATAALQQASIIYPNVDFTKSAIISLKSRERASTSSYESLNIQTGPLSQISADPNSSESTYDALIGINIQSIGPSPSIEVSPQEMANYSGSSWL
jgi:hypothetical protein